MAELSELKNALEWHAERGELVKKLTKLLGQMPKKKVDLQLKTADEAEFPGFTRRRINYFLDEWTRAAAWLFVPDEPLDEDMPAILCCHDRVPQGKDEPAGIEGDRSLAFARYFAEMGYVTLATDCVTAGERRLGRNGAAFDSAPFYKDNPRKTLLGKMLADHMRALDIFTEVPRVDSARIGVVGHGLGGTNALLLAALDGRVIACVASDAFTRFCEDDMSRWAEDDKLVLAPPLFKAAQKGELELEWEHILALAAPTATLVMAGLDSGRHAAPESAHVAVEEARQVYKMLGARNAIDYLEHRDGQRLSPESLEAAADWFERWL